MICLMKYLYWDVTRKHLKCTDCPFFEKCEADAKDGDGEDGDGDG